MNPDAKCRYGLYFRDGKRKVDYVLVYHHKRGSGSKTLARRVLQNDAALGARSGRQEQPLPGKSSPGRKGEQEAPMDFYEDDKRFRREEYEGNLLEAGLELERDEEVPIPLLIGVLGASGGGGVGGCAVSSEGGGDVSVLLALNPFLGKVDENATLVKIG